MPYYDIEILREDSGKPYAKLSGKAAERAAELGIVRLHISYRMPAALRLRRR